MALTFYTQSKKDYAPIWVRYRQHSIDAKARTLLYIETGRLKNNKILKHKMTASSDAHQKMLITEKNKALDFVANQIQLLEIKIVNDINNKKETDIVNSKWLTRAVQPRLADKTFIENFEEYIKVKKNKTKNTVTSLRTCVSAFKEFQVDTNTTYYLTNIDKDFKKAFIDWCDAQGYAISTLKLFLTKIKGVCYHFELEGEKISPYLKLLTKDIVDKKKNEIFLTIQEIETIKGLKLEDKHLDNARDWLVLSFYLGQRYGDYINLTKKNIHDDGTIRLTQQKTTAKVTIAITPSEQAIIDKYKGGFPKPIINSLLNQRFKKICRIAGIDKMTPTMQTKGRKNGNKSMVTEKPKYQLASTHIGRRSFVTHFYGKMKTSEIMRQTGHKTEKVFFEYLNEARDFDVEAVRKSKTNASQIKILK
jgi:integrase